MHLVITQVPYCHVSVLLLVYLTSQLNCALQIMGPLAIKRRTLLGNTFTCIFPNRFSFFTKSQYIVITLNIRTAGSSAKTRTRQVNKPLAAHT